MSQPFEALLQNARQSVEQIRTRMSEGIASDIDELNPKLEALTAALPSLDKATGQQYLQELVDLEASLGELRQDFIRQREGAQAAISQLTTRLKAGTAYAKSAAAAPPQDEDNSK